MTDGSTELAQSTGQVAGSLGELANLSRAFGTALTGAFRGAAIQGRELDAVLRGIAYQISNASLDRALSPVSSGIASSLENAASAAVRGASGYRLGAVFGDGAVVPFAAGGVVARPTYFPMADGRTGLLGEAGAEAIMPLKRGADGRLGVAVSDGGRAPVRVTINIATPDPEAFHRSEGQIATKLARAVGRGRRGL